MLNVLMPLQVFPDMCRIFSHIFRRSLNILSIPMSQKCNLYLSKTFIR